MFIKIAEKVIDTEIRALTLLKNQMSHEFNRAVNLLFRTKGKICVSGIGKSGHIAKKNILNIFVDWFTFFFYSSKRS